VSRLCEYMLPSRQRQIFMPWSTVQGGPRKDSHIAVTRARQQMSTHLAVALLDLKDPKPETLSLSQVGAAYVLPLNYTC